jgi:hypothetical protein
MTEFDYSSYSEIIISVGNQSITSVSGRADAGVLVQRDERASTAVLARVRVAGVRQRDLAERGRVADGAGALEPRAGLVVPHDVARTSVLATEPRPDVARVHMLAVLSHPHRRTSAETSRR